MSMPCDVTIENTGRSFICASGTVLDAAIEQGVQVPYNCRGGACGTCKAEVLEGAVEHGWVMGFAITDEEIAQGRCLICSSKPTTPRLVLRMLNSQSPAYSTAAIMPAEHVADVVALERLTPAVCRLTVLLPPQAELRFDSGMHMEILLDGIDAPRPYSIVTAPEAQGTPADRMLSFLIGRHAHGASSARLHEAIRVGDSLRIRGPYGTFRLPESPRGKILMLAGGTGLAPLLSMARWLLSRGYGDGIELLFCVRTQTDVFCMDELQRLAGTDAFRYRLFITRDDRRPLPAHWEQRRITDYLAGLPARPECSLVCVAGAPGFVASCKRQLALIGVEPEAVLSEAYESRSVAP